MARIVVISGRWCPNAATFRLLLAPRFVAPCTSAVYSASVMDDEHLSVERLFELACDSAKGQEISKEEDEHLGYCPECFNTLVEFAKNSKPM
jgi:protein-arginine kinase activator protein McsA